MNQGWLIGMTMKKVPSKFDFAYGETIATSVAAAIVPRFLWPDKPEAGGKGNLKRFWGYDLRGYSMNIGPFGEAYANFDKTGGVIYMFFYGLFFNLVLSLILKFSEKRPTIVLWVPFLFYYAIGVETDLLATMGSLVKGLIFTWIVFKIFRYRLQARFVMKTLSFFFRHPHPIYFSIEKLFHAVAADISIAAGRQFFRKGSKRTIHK